MSEYKERLIQDEESDGDNDITVTPPQSLHHEDHSNNTVKGTVTQIYTAAAAASSQSGFCGMNEDENSSNRSSSEVTIISVCDDQSECFNEDRNSTEPFILMKNEDFLAADGAEKKVEVMQEIQVKPVFSGSKKDPSPSIMKKKNLGPPPNYFMLALFATLCCFIPTGIVALIKSIEVTKLYRNGLQREAKNSSRKAWFWAKISIYIGMAIYVLAGVLVVIFILSHVAANGR